MVLRPLSPPDAPRVKAYRRRAREGTLAPVLLWFVSPLDVRLILDGHDRAVAALAEGSDPECVILERLVDADVRRRQLRTLTDEHERSAAALARRPGTERQRRRLAQGIGTAPGGPALRSGPHRRPAPSRRSGHLGRPGRPGDV
ncbi:hypothetical protein [Streptomyces coeruleorubidus]|uniref:hypothetical protein n=1 Tax=Streptomyces coeruleorubidus TaxID=116188 RepID=UPI0036C4F71E